MNSNRILLLLVIFLICGCSPKEQADLIILNAKVYTMDTSNPRAEALAIKDGLITNLGLQKDIETLASSKTKIIDAKGNFVMPGFIEGHGHFTGMGQSLININLLNTKNWKEVLKVVESKIKTSQKGEWINGRGWHQEKWDELPTEHFEGYPYHNSLSQLSKDNPILLFHASGHSLFANEAAMNAVGINKETADLIGGRIVRDDNGNAIGVFEERAMSPFTKAYSNYLENISEEEKYKTWLDGIEAAQELCLKNGVTSFQDAGSSFEELERFESLANHGKLKIRLWAMIRHSYDEMKDNLDKFPIINAGNNFFTCRSIKSEVDGALGSFGAWLLKPYHDKPGFEGQNTTSLPEVTNIARLAKQHDLQLCIHSIGDRANRIILDMFEAHMPSKGYKEGSRWRIEHAQHLNPDDIPRFGKLGVIASMQAVHCTSDSPFVEKRLGKQRSKEGAYPWRSLLDSGAKIANGTDVPVEDISPIDCIYASVTRKRKDNDLEFFTEQKMTRGEALRSYTIDNAFAAFEEESKGSLRIGKFADIIILSNNLLSCTDKEILDTKVLYTIVDGEIKYKG